ncbi:hypothetical protein H5410_024532 [Solanum commersonii]|uniref:Uncharacterized protein n=1 Tax=Solanum commersonii TaxID=4109 RepID=A0A9J5ZM83_SOLCO|nr:hypothetical protein H5410_024532 [Solanum commersonii]
MKEPKTSQQRFSFIGRCLSPIRKSGLPQQDRNIAQDEPIDPVNIDDHDLSNYGSPSASDSDDLPNAEESGDNVPFEVSSSDDDFLMPNRR